MSKQWILNGDFPEYRIAAICAGCQCTKDVGLLVCWNCFKYRSDLTPYRYFYEAGRGDFLAWLAYVNAQSVARRLERESVERHLTGEFDGFGCVSDADTGL